MIFWDVQSSSADHQVFYEHVRVQAALCRGLFLLSLNNLSNMELALGSYSYSTLIYSFFAFPVRESTVDPLGLLSCTIESSYNWRPTYLLALQLENTPITRPLLTKYPVATPVGKSWKGNCMCFSRERQALAQFCSLGLCMSLLCRPSVTSMDR